MLPIDVFHMVISDRLPLVLGSSSPRRREILASLGIPIRVVPGDADEARRPGETAASYLARVVRDKLSSVTSRVVESEGGAAVLVADTIVVVDDDVLGKPRDAAEAVELLGRIVGRSHAVRTRYAIFAPARAPDPIERTVETTVTMRSVTDEEIRRYAATGEGLDKAGAYAAQGIGAFLIETVLGSFTNVVGLPACEVVRDLVDLGLLVDFPRARG